MSDFDDIDAAAAEYALGTLDAAERRRMDALRKTDLAVDRAILAWQTRLAPLTETVPELAPPPDLFAQIERAIEDRPGSRSAETIDLDMRRRLRSWRNATFAAAAVAACLAIALGLEMETRAPSQTFVAVLQKDAAAPGFLLSLDPANRTLSVRPIAASLQTGKSFELWLVAKSTPPLSLGLIDPTAMSVKKIPASLQTAEQATWAVSLEPAGGSPTGAPTGPIVFSGKFAAIRS